MPSERSIDFVGIRTRTLDQLRCWRSTSIEPIILASSDRSVLWIGIDQRLVALNIDKGNIELALTLESNLLQLAIQIGFVAVLTETQVILLNTDFSIRLVKGIPDLPDHLSFDGNTAKVRLSDGNEYRFRTDTSK